MFQFFMSFYLCFSMSVNKLYHVCLHARVSECKTVCTDLTGGGCQSTSSREQICSTYMPIINKQPAAKSVRIINGKPMIVHLWFKIANDLIITTYRPAACAFVTNMVMVLPAIFLAAEDNISCILILLFIFAKLFIFQSATIRVAVTLPGVFLCQHNNCMSRSRRRV